MSPRARTVSPAGRGFSPAARGFSPPARGFSPAARASDAPDPSRVLVIGCGALARELVAVIDQAGLANVDLTCLPATLHNRPGGIPEAVRAKIRAARPRYERVFIAYADCGTGGLLDKVLADEGVERLPGAHCYEFYSGSAAFAAITDEDPATFFLTDFLARNFDRLVIRGLGLDRHPELLATYFGNYHRLIYLAQTFDPALVAAGRRAARRLGLAFELRRTGYGALSDSVVQVARGAASGSPDRSPAADRAPAADRSPAAGRSPAAVALDARESHLRAVPGPGSVRPLPEMQGADASRPRSDRFLRPAHESRRSRVAPRPLMHAMQAVDRDLLRAQGTATTTGPATAAGPATTVAPAPPATAAPARATARASTVLLDSET
jgi:hypothetical protein